MSSSSEVTRLLFDEVATPVGPVTLIADDQGYLRTLGWTEGHARMERALRGQMDSAIRAPNDDCESPLLVRVDNPHGFSAALRAYFAGTLSALDGIPTRATGTPFQRAVWEALRTIPVGKTMTYGALADRIGRPRAVRAVGLANGANPIALVVPCHRVIGASGKLVGYGAGLSRKEWLLAHEKTGLDERGSAPAGA